MGCLVGPAFSYEADVSESKRKEGKHKASFGAFYYMIKCNCGEKHKLLFVCF